MDEATKAAAASRVLRLPENMFLRSFLLKSKPRHHIGAANSSTGNGFSKYFTEIHTKAPHLYKSDVMAYRDFVLQHGPKLNVPDSPKNNKMAAKICLEANQISLRMFNLGDPGSPLSQALLKYHESICWATNGSENLAMGYANCSTLFYAIGEHEFALVCIALAKRYHLPAQLMAELSQRETICREKITTTKMCPLSCQSIIRPLRDPFLFNVARNPKIPFLAKGIIMKKLPEYGRSMVADQEFKAGAVILEEKMIACSVNSSLKYDVCHYCASLLSGPFIPCLRCTSVIYCSEKCRNGAMKSNHRFECGISEKLDHISYGATRIGLRMFFHGLNLFDGNVDKMMAFCKACGKTEADPFTLDYSNYDPLEEFKVFHQTKVPAVALNTDSLRFHAALYYSIVIEHPPVRALVNSEDKKGFMLQCIYEFMRTAMFLATYRLNLETFQLYSIAAVCNHSCIPNTYAVSHDGLLKFVVLRPIRKGEQILTSYNIMYGVEDLSHTVPCPMNFNCICMVCDPAKKRARLANSRARLSARPMYVPAGSGLLAPSDIGRKLKAMETFMNEHGHSHPHQDFDQFIGQYRKLLTTAFEADTINKLRLNST